MAGSALVLASPWSGRMLAADDRAEPALRFGLLADLHYADKDPAGMRHYRQTRSKLQEAVEKLNERKPSFVVELGDFIDAAPTIEQEVEWLKTVDALFPLENLRIIIIKTTVTEKLAGPGRQQYQNHGDAHDSLCIF